MTKKRKRKIWVVTVIILLMLIAATLLLPITHGHQNRSVAWVNCRYCFALTDGGKDTLFFSGLQADSGLWHLTIHRDSAMQTVNGNGFWFSAIPALTFSSGRLITSTKVAMPDKSLPQIKSCLPRRLAITKDQIYARVDNMSDEAKSLDYYINTHGVQDEGYNQVAEYYTIFKSKRADGKVLTARLQALTASRKLRVIYLVDYLVYITGERGNLSLNPVKCNRIAVNPQKGVAVLQTTNKLLPWGAAPLWAPVLRLSSDDDLVTDLAYNYTVQPPTELKEMKLSRVRSRIKKTDSEGVYRHTMPVMEGVVGSPVLDGFGRVIGMMNGGLIVSTECFND